MFEKHNFSDKYEIRHNGEVIYVAEGTRTWPDKDAAQAILDESSLSDKNKNAILSALGHIDTVDKTDETEE